MATKIFKSYEDFKSRSDKTVNGVSEEFAAKFDNWEAMNDTNEGCWCCIDCVYCNSSSYCVESSELIKCTNCWKCTDCYKCVKCEGSNKCKGCENLVYTSSAVNTKVDLTRYALKV